MSILSVDRLGVSFGQTPVFEDVSFELNEGDWLMMIGPNGSGKSTLVRAISGAVPYSGSITYLDGDIRRLRPGELARNIGILAQWDDTLTGAIAAATRRARRGFGGRSS